MSPEAITTIIVALLSAGGAAFLGTLLRGIGSLRSGARAHEREAVADLARWRDEAVDRARTVERDRDFWRGVAGGYAYQLVQAGGTPQPANPIAPSERGKGDQS